MPMDMLLLRGTMTNDNLAVYERGVGRRKWTQMDSYKEMLNGREWEGRGPLARSADRVHVATIVARVAGGGGERRRRLRRPQ